MARRFLNYCAGGHGRTITRPAKAKAGGLRAIAESFRPMLTHSGEMDFTPEAGALWEEFQHGNRKRIDRIDAMREEQISSLSSAPMQTLSVAMLMMPIALIVGAIFYGIGAGTAEGKQT